MAVEGKVKLNDRVLIFTAPLGGPELPGQANPGRRTMKLSLDAGLFRVTLLRGVTGEGAIGVDALHSLQSGGRGAKFLE